MTAHGELDVGLILEWRDQTPHRTELHSDLPENQSYPIRFVQRDRVGESSPYSDPIQAAKEWTEDPEDILFRDEMIMRGAPPIWTPGEPQVPGIGALRPFQTYQPKFNG